MLERRGGKCFAWDNGRAMLCVAVKRRVQLLHYDGSDFIELKEVALPHSPLHMMWLGNNVCFAFKTGCDPARLKRIDAPHVNGSRSTGRVLVFATR